MGQVIIKKSQSNIIQETAENTVLLNENLGKIICLTGIEKEMLSLLTDHKVEDVVCIMQDRYHDSDKKVIEEDIYKFIEQLMNLDFIGIRE